MGKKQTKYGNHPVWINRFTGYECLQNDSSSIWFSSQLEANVYRKLLNFDVLIREHIKIEIAPGSNNFNRYYWNADFRIHDLSEHSEIPPLIIEAKGLSLDCFPLKLQCLEQNNPSVFDNLIIVIADLDTKLPNHLNKILDKVIVLSDLSTHLESIGFKKYHGNR